MPIKERACNLHQQQQGQSLVNQMLCKDSLWRTEGPEASQHSLTTASSIIIFPGFIVLSWFQTSLTMAMIQGPAPYVRGEPPGTAEGQGCPAFSIVFKARKAGYQAQSAFPLGHALGQQGKSGKTPSHLQSRPS